MMEPKTRVGKRLKSHMDFVTLAPEFYESAAGRAWHWPEAGVQSLFMSAFLEGGDYCSESGFRFDADFMIWGDAHARVVVVVFDYDLTLFEATTVTSTARFIRPIRQCTEELQRFVDAPKNSNRGQSSGGPTNPFS